MCLAPVVLLDDGSRGIRVHGKALTADGEEHACRSPPTVIPVTLTWNHKVGAAANYGSLTIRASGVPLDEARAVDALTHAAAVACGYVSSGRMPVRVPAHKPASLEEALSII